MPADAVLAAVGGYGRDEIFPHSDVDLLILTAQAPAEHARRAIEAFVGACWDAGLEIGHSVRTTRECLDAALTHVTVQTSAMEARFLAGDREAFANLTARLSAQCDPAAFFRAKTLEMRQRHVKFEDTPYSLEPNTKESPGGLRDLHVILWTARAAGFGWHWPELARRGLLSATEVRALSRYERDVKCIRACLHVVAGRREDRLVFDLQAQVARLMFGAKARDARQASEELMQRYFRAAKQITQLNTILLLNLEAELFPQRDAAPEPIDDEFQNRGGLLDAVDPDVFERDPAAILRAFLRIEQHASVSGLSVPTLRAIWHARTRIDARFRARPENRALFLSLLQQPRGVTRVLRRMNQWSVLGRYLPAFGRIVGRMQHDLFHVYTVDQHILMVVRNLRRFAMDEYAHEYPFCSQLMASFPDRWRLYIAALFHDIAKGRGGDHSLLGKVDAKRFCRAHGLSNADSALIVVPGRAPPDDVLRRPEAGHLRPGRRHPLRATGGHRGAADGAVPADRRRHPRHQPQGLERLEGQAAAGPLPGDQARPGRRSAGPRRAAGRLAARGPPDPEPLRAVRGPLRGLLVEARRRLLHAHRRQRRGLADADALHADVVHARADRAGTASRRSARSSRRRLLPAPAGALRPDMGHPRPQRPVGARCADQTTGASATRWTAS